jgi:hypothetical protein
MIKTGWVFPSRFGLIHQAAFNHHQPGFHIIRLVFQDNPVYNTGSSLQAMDGK